MARTARQRAALRKAQLVSARKRRRKGKNRKLTKAQRRARTRVYVGALFAVAASTQVGALGFRKIGNAYMNRKSKKMAQALNFDENGKWKRKYAYGYRWL